MIVVVVGLRIGAAVGVVVGLNGGAAADSVGCVVEMFREAIALSSA